MNSTTDDTKEAKVLILGGISEAKQLAQQLHEKGVSLTYSIKGGIRDLNADFEIISGGFSRYCDQQSSKCPSTSGLNVFLEKNQITLLVDATHPYAETISANAIASAKHREIPHLQYIRPHWDLDKLSRAPYSLRVTELESYELILAEIQQYRRPFWAVGYKSLNHLASKQPTKQTWVFRTAIHPSIEQLKTIDKGPAQIEIIQQIGPFETNQETNLFQQKQIDALICKNSGGKFNEAKLKAASALDIPVFLLKRPNKFAANCQYSSIETLFNAIIARI